MYNEKTFNSIEEESDYITNVVERVTLAYKGKIVDQWNINWGKSDVLIDLLETDYDVRNAVIHNLDELGYSDLDWFDDVSTMDAEELYEVLMDELYFEFENYGDVNLYYGDLEIFTGETVED